MQDYAKASGRGMSGVFRRMNEALVEAVGTATEEAGARLEDADDRACGRRLPSSPSSGGRGRPVTAPRSVASALRGAT
jgi:hypothetical protein